MRAVYKTFSENQYRPADVNHPPTDIILEVDEFKSWKARLKQSEEDLKAALALCGNMSRIMRERKNNIDGNPKDAPGYVVISKECYVHKIWGFEKEERFNLYKITFSTPWDMSLCEAEVNILIRQDFENGLILLADPEDKDRTIKMCHLEEDLDTVVKLYAGDHSTILGCVCRANGKSGLWEASMITNFEPYVHERHRVKYV